MFVAQLSFSAKQLDSTVGDLVKELVHFSYHQGLIVHLENDIIYSKNGNIILQCITPEKYKFDTIDRSYIFGKLEELQVSITIDYLGEATFAPDVCSCANSGFYILLASDFIPLTCGICGNAVPLYRIPPTYASDPSYYDINCWNKVNLAWSSIEFYSVHEAFAQKELCDIQSHQNQQALAIRDKIETLSGVECYYFIEELRHINNLNAETVDICPGCEDKWTVCDFSDRYELKCKSCKLVTNGCI